MAFTPRDQEQFSTQRRGLQDRYWLRQLRTGRPDPVGLRQLAQLSERENLARGGGLFGPLGPSNMAPLFEAIQAMNPDQEIEIAGGAGQDPTLRQFRGDVAPSLQALRRIARMREMQ